MKKGTIVLTKFPFTDLSASKRRPAIIVSKTNKKKNDVIVAFISSVVSNSITESDFIIKISNKDFNKSGLRKESVIKLDKLATLNKSIFTGELGFLSIESLKEINKKLKIVLDINE